MTILTVLLQGALLSLIEALVQAIILSPRPHFSPTGKLYHTVERWPEKHFYLFWNTVRGIMAAVLVWMAPTLGWTNLALAIELWCVHELLFPLMLNLMRHQQLDYLAIPGADGSQWDAKWHHLFGGRRWLALLVKVVVVSGIGALCYIRWLQTTT